MEPGNNQRGFVLLEILIAVALISIVLLLLLTIGVQSLNLSNTIGKTTEVDSWLKEEMEAVRSFRDGTTWGTNGIGTLATGSSNPYYATLDTSVNPPKWTLQAGTETLSTATRRVHFDRVSRDSSGGVDPVYKGGGDDNNTRKVTVTVVKDGVTHQLIMYLTNWKQ